MIRCTKCDKMRDDKDYSNGCECGATKEDLECLFEGSSLQSHINGVLCDNCNGTIQEQLLRWYERIKNAHRLNPKSIFWKEAVDCIVNKYISFDKDCRAFIKEVTKYDNEWVGKKTLLDMYLAHKEKQNGGL